ncbi:hypothetical protein TWF730_008262 [Orbilia blumenaviensis]|uniref:Uncharacterized protein n=1 Tax=Orbilia blumenaviensis TaxID=1796055 RepID=A0AAV9V331_9PEZI
MCSRLLSLPRELREEILSHAFRPTVLFYFRECDSSGRCDEENDTPRIFLSYKIGPTPRPLFLIHPTITEEMRSLDPILRARMSKIIDVAMPFADKSEHRFWDRFFTPDPSPAFLEIARNGRFIFDVAPSGAIDAFDVIAISLPLARSIKYIAFGGFTLQVLKTLFAHCPVETVAFFCFPTQTDRWVYTEDMLSRLAGYGGRQNNPLLYSRLEYIFGRKKLATNARIMEKLPSPRIPMRPKCTRRQMRNDEVEERGRAVFILDEDEDGMLIKSTEDMVIVYEFEEPSLL